VTASGATRELLSWHVLPKTWLVLP